jgi:hypothetical protein
MPELSKEEQETLRRLQEAAEEQRRILADPERAHPVRNPDKFADPVGLDENGRPLPGSQRRRGPLPQE